MFQSIRGAVTGWYLTLATAQTVDLAIRPILLSPSGYGRVNELEDTVACRRYAHFKQLGLEGLFLLLQRQSLLRIELCAENDTIGINKGRRRGVTHKT